MNRTVTNFGSELCVKLSTDQWVVGKQVDEREVYIIVTTKNSNLIEVMAEVDKLISKEFRNICLLLIGIAKKLYWLWANAFPYN